MIHICIWKFLYLVFFFFFVIYHNATVSSFSGIDFEELKMIQLILSASLLGAFLQQAV